MIRATVMQAPVKDLVESLTVSVVRKGEVITPEMLEIDYASLNETERKKVDDFFNLILSKSNKGDE